MLIVAQPKSASTSLLKSLAKIGKLNFKNGQSKTVKDELCEGFDELQKYHTTTHKRSKEFLQTWCDRKDSIYKDHILPTKEHIDYLKDKKFIMLLRNPFDTLDNYVRMVEKYRSNKMSKKESEELKLELFLKIDFDKFSNDIYEYNKKWKETKLGLLIDYDELVMCPKNTLLKCIRYLGISIKDEVVLLKSKGNHGYNTYTGVGYQRAKNKWPKS
jgi:hypothetical protein